VRVLITVTSGFFDPVLGLRTEVVSKEAAAGRRASAGQNRRRWLRKVTVVAGLDVAVAVSITATGCFCRWRCD